MGAGGAVARRVGSVALGAGLAVGAVTGFLAWALPLLTRPKRYDQLAEPADHGLTHEDVTLTTADGVELHGWWIESPDPRGTILMCHGFGGSKDPDLAYAKFLHPRYHLLMFDFRCHGRSGGECTSLGYLELQDVEAALAWLRDRKGIERVGALGFSMGGAVALLAAARFPQIVTVVSDSGYAHLQHALEREGKRRGFPPVVRSALAWILVHAAAKHLGYRLQHGQPMEIVHRIAPRPILFIHGTEDDLVPVEDAHLLHARAGEPKDLWIIPGAGHVDNLATARDAYRERVLAFFDRTLAAVADETAAD